MTQPAQRNLLTEDEYLARERSAETKSELIHGEVVAMAGGSPRHNAIAMNVASAIKSRLAGRRCVVFGSDQRVHVPATGLYTYPDVTIACGAPRFHAKDRDTLLSPTVIVEVLSSSTEAYDRGAKFAHYRGISSLEEYVLVAQEERRVEHYRRVESGQWLLTPIEGEDALVALPAFDIEVPLRELYAGLDLLEEGGASGEPPPP